MDSRKSRSRSKIDAPPVTASPVTQVPVTQANRRVFGLRPDVVAIIGTIALGTAGSATWDIIAKPGVVRASRWCFDLITRWNNQIDNMIFEAAALDPTTLPSLILLVVLSGVCVGLFGFAVGVVTRKLVIRLQPRRNGMEVAAKTRWAKVAHQAVIIITTCVVITVSIIAWIATQVVNEAILVWRAYHNNYRRLEFVVQKSDLQSINSRFARMKSRDDYQMVYLDMAAFAEKNGIELNTIATRKTKEE